jgi:hypothetical protein
MVEITAEFDGAVQAVSWLCTWGAREFTLGRDAHASFVVPEDWRAGPLVRLAADGGFEVVFDASFAGARATRGIAETRTLDELIARGDAQPDGDAFVCAVAPGERFVLSRGALSFAVEGSPAPMPHRLAPPIDWMQLVLTFGTAAALCVCVLVYLVTPHRPAPVFGGELDPRFVAHFLLPPTSAPQPDAHVGNLPIWLSTHTDATGHAHGGTEGAMGTPHTEKNRAALYLLKGPKDNPDPHLAKMLAEERAQNAGVLGILKASEGSHLASIFGRDSALGNDAENVLGGLVGTQIGEAYGVGGLGLVGAGGGGGGTGEGTIGLGNLGTIGRGSGSGYGSGYSHGAGGLGGRRAHAPEVIPGTAIVCATNKPRCPLDKEVIRRVIRRHLNEVRFCYERELQTLASPDLYGRVTMQFTIGTGGQVLASVVQSSTMNRPSVEQCVAQAVRRWEFPKPAGVVMVSYPFVFRNAGADD